MIEIVGNKETLVEKKTPCVCILRGDLKFKKGRKSSKVEKEHGCDYSLFFFLEGSSDILPLCFY